MEVWGSRVRARPAGVAWMWPSGQMALTDALLHCKIGCFMSYGGGIRSSRQQVTEAHRSSADRRSSPPPPDCTRMKLRRSATCCRTEAAKDYSSSPATTVPIDAWEHPSVTNALALRSNGSRPGGTLDVDRTQRLWWPGDAQPHRRHQTESGRIAGVKTSFRGRWQAACANCFVVISQHISPLSRVDCRQGQP